MPYDPIPVDTRKGEQFAPAYVAINPNSKVPAIVDGDVTVFDSNAILLYLAEKTGKFLPKDGPNARAELLSCLMFVGTGAAPFLGQAMHFLHYAPERVPYAINRYMYEAKRHYNVIETRLSSRRYMLGDSYTIVDMALRGPARLVPEILGADGWDGLPNLKRLYDEIIARPAFARASALKDKHAFKAEFDDEARRNMYPQNVVRE